MRVLEFIGLLDEWQAGGHRAVLATLARVEGSAPRDPGACMAVRDDGAMHGSISGGCVEAAVAHEAQAVLREGRARVATFGISDDLARSVGLTCGGTLHVLIDEPAPAFVRALHEALTSGRALGAAATMDERAARLAILADAAIGSLGSAELDERVCDEVRDTLPAVAAEVRIYGETEVLLERDVEQPKMYVFGGVDFAAALMRLAKTLGYEVTLCDARPAFATAERFPMADRVVAQWPDEFLRAAPVDERTAIVSLTHDEKFDIPLLLAALTSRAGYVGAMGSRRTNERRMQLLREAGATPAQCERLRAPVGLDIGGRTPEEMAVAICAEIVAQRYGRSGGSLSGTLGAIRGAGGNIAASRIAGDGSSR